MCGSPDTSPRSGSLRKTAHTPPRLTSWETRNRRRIVSPADTQAALRCPRTLLCTFARFRPPNTPWSAEACLPELCVTQPEKICSSIVFCQCRAPGLSAGVPRGASALLPLSPYGLVENHSFGGCATPSGDARLPRLRNSRRECSSRLSCHRALLAELRGGSRSDA
jgi:hypothetical protein